MKRFALFVLFSIVGINAQDQLRDYGPHRSRHMADTMFAADSIDTVKDESGNTRDCIGYMNSCKSDTGKTIEVNFQNDPAGVFTILPAEPGIMHGAFYRIWRWRNTTADPDSLVFFLKVNK
jgi:hypothetical protein